MKRWDYTKTLLIALIAILLSAPSLAGDRRKSLDQAVEEARDRYPGRVLSAETKNRGGRESHKIRILTNDGRVKRINVDAESGRFERRSKR